MSNSSTSSILKEQAGSRNLVVIFETSCFIFFIALPYSSQSEIDRPTSQRYYKSKPGSNHVIILKHHFIYLFIRSTNVYTSTQILVLGAVRRMQRWRIKHILLKGHEVSVDRWAWLIILQKPNDNI
jgi:hypothetical protein